MSRVIRLFVSSTFKDFADERDALMQHTFSTLQEECRRDGISFQVLDLRWGISEQSALNNDTLRICLEEIERCQRISPDVNFLLMVGERSGWHPLPTEISRGEWELLMQAGEHAAAKDVGWPRLKSLMEAWYAVDENDMECPRCLRPREGIYAEDPAAFHTAEKELREGLVWLVEQAGLPSEEMGKYQDSATTQEIVRGLLRNPDRLRGQTFAMFQDDPDSVEDEISRAECRRLRERIRQNLPDSQIHTYRVGDNAYLAAVEAFLRQKIQEEKERYQAIGAFEETLRSEEREQHYLERGYSSRGELEEAFARFLESHAGETLLLTGPSGSGKSWLIRHFLREAGENITAAVFTDVQPACRRMQNIYAYLLYRLGISVGKAPADNAELRDWFEKALQSLPEDRPVRIFVDCVEGIEDWREQADSLLGITVPRNVTLIVSAISQNALKRQEREMKIPCFSMPPLSRAGAVRQILEYLEKGGRRLTAHQQEILSENIPETPIPLQAAVIAEGLMRQRSFTAFVPQDSLYSLEDTLRYFCLRTGQKEYTVLRRHILGYFALVHVGLQEEELLRLLTVDEAVQKEIRNIHGDDNRRLQNALAISFPPALWARAYYEIRPVLTEIRQDGMILLSLRHNRLREAILRLLEKTEVRALQENLVRYFQDEERNPWAWISGKGEIHPNRRKYEELEPLLRTSDREEDRRRFLEDVRYADCALRFGGLLSLVKIYEQWVRRKKESGTPAEILFLLQEKPELFSLFPDSFLPAVVSRGLASDRLLREYRLPGYIKGQEKSRKAGRYHFHDMEQGRMALRADGILAVLSRGMIHMADLRLGITLPVYCRVPMEDGWIYWNREDLCVRDESRRVVLCFDGEELFVRAVMPATPYEKIEAPDRLQPTDPYAWPEYEVMFSPYYRHLSFRGRNGVTRAALPYEEDESPRVRFRAHTVCIETKGRYLDIIDAQAGRLRGKRRSYFAIDEYTVTSDGRFVLVRLLDGSMTLVDTEVLPAGEAVDLRENIGGASGLRRTLAEVGKMFFAGARSAINTDIAVKDGYTALHRGDADKGTDLLPQRMVFSLRYGYAACYYRRGSSSMLGIYSLKDHQLLRMEEDIPEMFESDQVRLPMYTVRNGRCVVLCLGGAWHLYDIESGAHEVCAERPKEDADEKLSAMIREQYASGIMEYRTQSEGSVSRHTADLSGVEGRSALGKISDDALEAVIKSLRVVLFRGERKFRDAGMLYEELRHLPVCFDPEKGYFWLIDPVHDMIHVYDVHGRCLARDQIDMDATWADIDEYGRLVVMSGDSGQSVIRELITV